MRLLPLSFVCSIACGGSAASTPGEPPVTGSTETKPPEQQRPTPSSSSNPTWCDGIGSHDFCADFDAEDPLAAWDDALRGTDRKQKDHDELAPSQRSAPNALRLTGNKITTEAASETAFYPWSGMFLTKKLPVTTSTKATVSFDLFAESVKWSTGVVEFRGRTSTNAIAFGVSLSVGEDASYLAAALGTIPKLPPIAKNRWVRVEIAIDDNGGTGGIAALAFDGVNAGTATFEGSLASSAETTLYLGVSRSAPAEAYDVRYDNVVVDLQ